jgi:hypothetical protein
MPGIWGGWGVFAGFVVSGEAEFQGRVPETDGGSRWGKTLKRFTGWGHYFIGAGKGGLNEWIMAKQFS